MTWGEFKKYVEDFGVKDSMVIDFIDYSPTEDFQTKDEKKPEVFYNGDTYKSDFWVM
jgi:hypothetical protein